MSSARRRPKNAVKPPLDLSARRQPPARRARDRTDLVLEVDLPTVMQAFDATDELGERRIDRRQFAALCKYAGVRMDPLAFQRAVLKRYGGIPPPEGMQQSVRGSAGNSPPLSPRFSSGHSLTQLLRHGDVAEWTYAEAERGGVLELDDTLLLLFASYAPSHVRREAAKVTRARRAAEVRRAAQEAAASPVIGGNGIRSGGGGGGGKSESAKAASADLDRRLEVVFRECDADHDGLVSFDDIAKVVKECPRDFLAVMVLKHTPEVVEAVARDTALLRERTLWDLLRRASIPPDAISALAKGKTSPPLTVANLLTQWQALRPQIEELVELAVLSRLSAVVNVLKRHGPLAVAKLPWPTSLHDSCPEYTIDHELLRDVYGNTREPPVTLESSRLTLHDFQQLVAGALHASNWANYTRDDASSVAPRSRGWVRAAAGSPSAGQPTASPANRSSAAATAKAHSHARSATGMLSSMAAADDHKNSDKDGFVDFLEATRRHKASQQREAARLSALDSMAATIVPDRLGSAARAASSSPRRSAEEEQEEEEDVGGGGGASLKGSVFGQSLRRRSLWVDPLQSVTRRRSVAFLTAGGSSDSDDDDSIAEARRAADAILRDLSGCATGGAASPAPSESQRGSPSPARDRQHGSAPRSSGSDLRDADHSTPPLEPHVDTSAGGNKWRSCNVGAASAPEFRCDFPEARWFAPDAGRNAPPPKPSHAMPPAVSIASPARRGPALLRTGTTKTADTHTAPPQERFGSMLRRCGRLNHYTVRGETEGMAVIEPRPGALGRPSAAPSLASTSGRASPAASASAAASVAAPPPPVTVTAKQQRPPSASSPRGCAAASARAKTGAAPPSAVAAYDPPQRPLSARRRPHPPQRGLLRSHGGAAPTFAARVVTATPRGWQTINEDG